MGIAYQLTFFLALTLLAIVITIFVFAVSLLGRAVEVASREQEKTTKEQKHTTEREIADIQKQISDLTKKEHIGRELRELEKRLKRLGKRDKNFAKNLGRIGGIPGLLRVRGGVTYPAISLAIALVLNGVAWYLSNSIQIFIIPIPLIIWILALLAIGYSISRIYKSLRAVESVAITSEGEAERRLAQAVKVSLLELEEERKPALELHFKDAEPPFHMKAESEMNIAINISVTKGDVARSPQVYFVAPPGFEFTDIDKWLPPASEKFANYASAGINFPDIQKGIYRLGRFKIKAPSQPKHYVAFYRVYCEGYDSDYEPFDIVVE